MTGEAMVALAAIGAVGLYLAPYWAQHRARHLTRIPAYVADIEDSAVKLIEDETVPESVAHFVCRLAPMASSPNLARMIVWDILTGRFFYKVGVHPRSEFGVGLEGLTSEQRSLFARFFSHVLFSSVSSDPIFASLLWRIVTWGMMQSSTSDDVEPQKAQSIAVEVSRARPSLIAA